ncbi:L,D-transpeptidase [Aestuariivivens sediminicola]|uniref:L,D-transpeptidase n=1 Tax=Aestuariivivens sediminicola TaxID=2913560 RepID=UPI001F58D5C2|nr:L,D-transpeptidase [Aestuariivivens sediminicola]
MKRISKWALMTLLLLLVSFKVSCQKQDPFSDNPDSRGGNALLEHPLPLNIRIERNISVAHYFHYMDSIVSTYDSITPYTLTEHLLVKSNPWIIDTLRNTDYYRMIARDSFVYNQRKLIALAKGSDLMIPDASTAAKLMKALKHTYLDVNIPEFKLRIYEDSLKLYEFPIRVGRHEKKYLEMSGRIEDLRTKPGIGTIVGYNKNPRYVNPVNNHEYFVTKRDDNRVTRLPLIPFLETEINGLRNGQLIHPTTNPITLGKAYSHGCIGTNESDAWVIYYYAPINTKIIIRYDLNVIDDHGSPQKLEDIYGYDF